MPGYRLGVTDPLYTALAPPPAKSALVGDPNGLTWFEESIQTDGEALPSARYAVAFSGSEEQVIYGEQCLAPAFCFTWQRWPAESSSHDKK